VALTFHQFSPIHPCFFQVTTALLECPSIHSRVFHMVPTLHDFKYPLLYWCADKSLARPTSRCILFDGENVSFDASLV
jgi:hypothetical protein